MAIDMNFISIHTIDIKSISILFQILIVERSEDSVKRVRDRNEEMFCFKNRFSPLHRIFILKKDLNAAFVDEFAPFSAYLGSHVAKNHK